MPDVQLPLPPDLMLPTLRAVIGVGGSGSYPEIDAKALELANISEAQKAVVYENDSTAKGPKILHRLAWARTMLKRIGALEGAGYGQWAATEYGFELASMAETAAIAAIEQAVGRSSRLARRLQRRFGRSHSPNSWSAS